MTYALVKFSLPPSRIALACIAISTSAFISAMPNPPSLILSKVWSTSVSSLPSSSSSRTSSANITRRRPADSAVPLPLPLPPATPASSLGALRVLPSSDPGALGALAALFPSLFPACAPGLDAGLPMMSSSPSFDWFRIQTFFKEIKNEIHNNQQNQ